MGSTRPIVATSIPECRLYEELFDVVETHDAFVEAVAAILKRDSDDGRAADRHAWAASHTCCRGRRPRGRDVGPRCAGGESEASVGLNPSRNLAERRKPVALRGL